MDYMILAEDLSPKKPRRLTLNIDDAEILSDIAQRAGVKSLEMMSATCELTRQGDGCRIHLTGQLNASMTQDCVTTLDEITTKIESEPFDAWFIDEETVLSFQSNKLKKQQDSQSKMDGEAGEKHMLEEEEAPEPLTNGRIDVLEAVIQFLILSVNPFPRSDQEADAFEYSEFSKESPFASLANLKQGQSGGE